MSIMNQKSRARINCKPCPGPEIRRVYLQPLQEAVGVLEEPVHEEDGLLIVALSNHNCHFAIVFRKESPEAEVIREKLGGELVGRKLAILRVNNTELLVFIRKIQEE